MHKHFAAKCAWSRDLRQRTYTETKKQCFMDFLNYVFPEVIKRNWATKSVISIQKTPKYRGRTNLFHKCKNLKSFICTKWQVLFILGHTYIAKVGRSWWLQPVISMIFIVYDMMWNVIWYILWWLLWEASQVVLYYNSHNLVGNEYN